MFLNNHHNATISYSFSVARYYQPSLSIWLSVDPLSDKYPGVSPYTYCGNNPVVLKDPNGREIWILGSESERNNAFYDMQNGTSLSLSMDENGRISTSGETINGEKLTRADKKLLKAINDQNVIANIYVSPSNNENSAGGAYMGTEYDPSTKTATSCNSVNLEKMQLTEQKYGAQSGSGIIHEATEGYKAGLISLKRKMDIMPAVRERVTWTDYVKVSSVSQTLSPATTITTIKSINEKRFEYLPVYPRDYQLYQKADRWATKAPNTYKMHRQ